MKRKQVCQFKIKEVDGTDASIQKELRKLHRRLFRADKLPEFGLGYWWIAYCKGRPVGFTGMHKAKNIADGGYFIRSGVLLSYRGHGLQRKFIRVREKKARALGHTVLVTDTFQNIYSANNLIREGFTLYDPKVKWALIDALYWRKDLWQRN